MYMFVGSEFKRCWNSEHFNGHVEYSYHSYCKITYLDYTVDPWSCRSSLIRPPRQSQAQNVIWSDPISEITPFVC